MNAGIVLIHPDPRKNESLATITKGMGSDVLSSTIYLDFYRAPLLNPS